MKKILLFFIVFLFSCKFVLSQLNSSSNILLQINDIVKREQSNFNVKSVFLTADKVSTENNILHIYFNSFTSFSEKELPADFIESLPEFLNEIANKSGNKGIMLYAKDKKTSEWKTLDFFANHPERAIYIPEKNTDAPNESSSNKNGSSFYRVFPTSGSPLPTGVLSGKTVWLSPGHGWQNTGTGLGFLTQRGTTNEIVEDFTTAESIDYYLINYLMNAGANVWSVRERDYNSNQIIVDNDNAASGYSETGTWSTGSAAGYGGTYRVATSSSTETATAIFTPTVTASGYYWVSLRFIAGSNRATDSKYTIIHSGDTSVVKVNQEIHSGTWIYVGQFYFTAGSNNKIILSNQSNEVSQAIIADAVRLGGGIGTSPDCVYTTEAASGRPRYEEAARQYAQFQGYPSCVEDVTVRPKYSEYELAKGTSSEINNAVYVAWHTNAGGGTGTESYTYNGLGSGRPTITAGSVNLRNYIHNQLISDIKAGWNSSWTDRGLKDANFGELRELNTIPGTLIELAFHDLASDAAELKNPEFRRLAARSIYKGIVKFFSNRDGITLSILPEQPTSVYAKNIGSNQIQLSWAAPVTGGIFGDAATGYKVYISTNGKSFKEGIPVASNNYTFIGDAGTIYYFKISATNAGGESFTSSVVSAKTPNTGSTSIPYLIVDGFDRLDAGAMIPRNESSALGTVKRMFLDKMNRYDYMIEHAKGLANCNNIAFDGCQNEAVINGNVLLTNYTAVDWFVGEESTVDKTLDAIERTLLKSYLNAGGNLLLSGSEVGWDIGRAASANVDLDLFNNYLKASYIGDDAGSYDFTGTSSFFTSQSGSFDNGTNGYYDVDFPDRVAANGGTTFLNYVGGTADAAAIGYSGSYKSIYLAFPLEAVTSDVVRNNLFCNAVAYLTPSIVVPAIGLDFTGNANGNFNFLNWKTASEPNVAYFILERSENGIFFIETSTKISAKGSTLKGAAYNFTDKAIFNTTYYRIKIVDIDGKVTYSSILKLSTNKQSNLFTVKENPTKNNIGLILFNSNSLFEITLTDMQGKVAYKQHYSNFNDGNITINCSNYAKGMYLLTVTTNKEKQVEKIIIQ